MGTLYIVATPIGNLGDISPRALATLREVALIAAEDTRHTGRLLQHFEIATPLVSYHAFNERARRDRLMEALANGDVALVSDAGTPGISDPGQALVAAALEAGFPVSPVPGPSSLTAAVSASGLVDGPLTFLGFLPRQASARSQLLRRAASTGFALTLFEAPSRVAATLGELLEIAGDRDAVLWRELTKLHEESRFGRISALIDEVSAHQPRGECVIVIGAQTDPAQSSEEPEVVLARLLQSGLKPSDAAREAAAITGLPRSELYARIRALRGQG